MRGKVSCDPVGPLVFINPNSSAGMTESIAAQARLAAPGVGIEGWTSVDGPPAIQGREDGAAAVPPLLRLVAAAEAQGARGVAIACFDDTGLAEARAAVGLPVVGIGQAGYHMAAALAPPFAVVTTLAVSVPILTENISASGLGGVCAGVRASGVPVLELERAPGTATAAIAAQAAEAVTADGARSIVLGCAGMGGLAAELRQRLRVPVIDGVAAAAAALAHATLPAA